MQSSISLILLKYIQSCLMYIRGCIFRNKYDKPEMFIFLAKIDMIKYNEKDTIHSYVRLFLQYYQKVYM